MKNILKKLYYGEIVPFERNAPDDREYKEINDKIQIEKKYFASIIPSEDLHRFNELEDLYNQSGKADEADIFALGFKLGVEFIIEALSEQ